MIRCYPIVHHAYRRTRRHFRRHIVGHGVAFTGLVCASVPLWLWSHVPPAAIDYSPAVAVPEPTSVAVLLGALGCLLIAKIVTRA